MIVLAFCFGCGEDGPTTTGIVNGFVVNPSLTPVSGAAVTVGDASSTTASNGTFNVTSVKSGLQTLSVTASGYIPSTRQVTVSALEPTSVPMIVLDQKDSKSTEIGPGGGEAASTDGAVKLVIPAGALKEAVSVSLSHPDLTAAPLAAPEGYKIIYLVYISPQGTLLDAAATLTIPLPAEAVSSSSVPFFHFDMASLSWTAAGSGSVSTSTVSLSITKFGWFAAAIPVSSGSVSGKVVNSSGLAIAGASVWTGSNITAADSDGNYLLANVPSGAAVINAAASGYTSNNVSVTVASGAIVYAASIVLTSTSSSYGTITGKITKAADSSAVSGAKVSSSGKETYTDASGNYVLSEINPGTVTVSVNAYGFASTTDTVVVSAGSTSNKDFSLTAVSVSSFSDDFETPYIPWTYGGIWHRAQNSSTIIDTLAPDYVSLPDYASTAGAIPSAKSGSYSAWFGSDALGCYIGTQQTDPVDPALSGGSSVLRMQGDLTTPEIDLNGYADATLIFWTWWEVEGVNPATGYDIMKVKVSRYGETTWTDLLVINPVDDPDPDSKIAYVPYSSGGYNKAGVWTKHQLSLSPYVGSKIQVRFSFDTYDKKYNGFRGWFIDDVSISPDRLSLSSISSYDIIKTRGRIQNAPRNR